MIYFKKLLISSFILLGLFTLSVVSLEAVSNYVNEVQATKHPLAALFGFFLTTLLYGGLFIAMLLLFLYNKVRKWVGFSHKSGYVLIAVLVPVSAITFFVFLYHEVRFAEIISFIQILVVGFGVNYLDRKYMQKVPQ